MINNSLDARITNSLETYIPYIYVNGLPLFTALMETEVPET